MEAAYDEVEILQRVARSVGKPEWIESCKEYYKDVNNFWRIRIEFSRKIELNLLVTIVMWSNYSTLLFIKDLMVTISAWSLKLWVSIYLKSSKDMITKE